jgi:beta-N-acetylhexosaminidase
MCRQLPILLLILSFFSFSWASEDLSLEQKVGQMFIFGFSGTKINKNLKTHLKTLQPGAVIVFGRNIKNLTQVSELNTELQKLALGYSNIPLFIAIDQEGGAVSRIKTSPGLPSAYTIGNTNDPALSFQAGKVTGQILSLLGFNMNLAPVLDVTDAQLQSFISSRSFSESPHKVSSMGLAFAQGLEESRVFPVAKHFPGHGPISLDTHRTTPHRQVSYQTLLNTDLVPFSQYASSDISGGIMVAHISYPLIDASHLPATFSKHIITQVLTSEMKYKGLIMTDDIEMAGAAALAKIEDRAVAAVLAGNDLIMLAWSQDLQKRAFNAVIQAVKSGQIPMERIDESVNKILKFKSQYLSTENRTLASNRNLKNSLKKIQFSNIYSDIVSRFFKSLPGLEKSDKIFKDYHIVSASKNFIDSFRRYIKNQNTTTSSSLSALKKEKSQSLLVVHITNASQLKDLYSLSREQKKRTLVISSYAKTHFEDKSSFLDIVEVYSIHPNLGGFTADAINRTSTEISLFDSTYY